MKQAIDLKIGDRIKTAYSYVEVREIKIYKGWVNVFYTTSPDTKNRYENPNPWKFRCSHPLSIHQTPII